MTNFLQRLKEKLIQAGGPSWVSSSCAHTQKTLLSGLSWCLRYPSPLLLHLFSFPKEMLQNNTTHWKFHKTNKPSFQGVMMLVCSTYSSLTRKYNTRVCIMGFCYLKCESCSMYSSNS
jgi:hypothetical protein